MVIAGPQLICLCLTEMRTVEIVRRRRDGRAAPARRGCRLAGAPPARDLTRVMLAKTSVQMISGEIFYSRFINPPNKGLPAEFNEFRKIKIWQNYFKTETLLNFNSGDIFIRYRKLTNIKGTI